MYISPYSQYVSGRTNVNVNQEIPLHTRRVKLPETKNVNCVI